jgi:hypothetical protein
VEFTDVYVGSKALISLVVLSMDELVITFDPPPLYCVNTYKQLKEISVRCLYYLHGQT